MRDKAFLEGSFVQVTQPGLSLFSRFVWVGQVVGGKVKLKPGFNSWHFTDNEPPEKYRRGSLGTVASVCDIKTTTAEFYEAATSYPL